LLLNDSRSFLCGFEGADESGRSEARKTGSESKPESEGSISRKEEQAR
jgi:hypothetical protein